METTRMTDYVLQHTAAVMGKRADQVLQEQLGIGLAQYRVLLMLEHFPETTQRRLADHLGQTEAGISRQMKLLEHKGMLVVRQSERSQREHVIVLTTKGFRLMQAAHGILDQHLEPLYNTLSEKEQRQLRQLLDKLHDQLCREDKLMACDRPFDPWLSDKS